MIYITTPQSPVYPQITLEELLFMPDYNPKPILWNFANTRTREAERAPAELMRKIDVNALISRLSKFNADTEYLRSKPRKELYREFFIPKKGSEGGRIKWRRIDAPNPDLMNALYTLKSIFEDNFRVLYHTSAFAYIKKRSTIDAIKRHQENESRWFGKYDLSDFFGSTTLDFVMDMFSMVFPISEVARRPDGRAELRKALELAFLDGGLPQGTPISPLITNVMMIPIDFKLSNGLRSLENQRYIYTRYADDFLVSSRFDFDFRKIEKYIVDTLRGFGAPFSINSEKTRYGSSSGKNFNLGLMLNKDNQITVGHKKKRQLQAMLSSYVMDKMHGKSWEKNDVQAMEGYRNYYHMVEGEVIDRIVQHLNEKFRVDIMQMIREDLKV